MVLNYRYVVPHMAEDVHGAVFIANTFFLHYFLLISLTWNLCIHQRKCTHNELVTIMRENRDKVKSVYPENSFPQLFWNQQLLVASKTKACSMKWHPMMVHWCLYLRHVYDLNQTPIHSELATLSKPAGGTLNLK